MSDDALTELLRKCHREELIPLAEALDIRHGPMKLDDLAHAIDVTMRRRGASDVENIALRGGEGPAYSDVLRRVANRMGVDATEQDAVEDVERWLVEAQERGADPGERRPLVRQLTEPTSPLPGCFFFAWMMRPRFDLVTPAVLEVAQLRSRVRRRVTIGVVGSPSSGKDAALAAIFGMQTGNVSPVAGSTRAVEIHRLDGPAALFLVNTPGLGDVTEEVTEQAREVLDHIDVYVYVLNAQGGVQEREKSDYDAVVDTGRPVLAVVNKIDTIREDQRRRYLSDARAKLGAPEGAFLPAAFDPLPQLSDAPIGVPAVRQWIADTLAAHGKDVDQLPWRHRVTRVERD